MDGKQLLYEVRQALNEATGTGFLEDRLTYGYLYEAAIEFVNRTHCIRKTQSITTIADQAAYDLDGDYLKLYLANTENNFFIKYNDGTSDFFVINKDYEDIIFSNNTTSQVVPDRFTIIDNPTDPSQLTGTATSAGALSGGQATLTDSAADFTNVYPGDYVHNTTDASDGVVLSKTSTTVLVTALFDGTDNDWDSSDAYVLQPHSRFQLVLDPAPSTSGNTVTVYYVQRPNPVYSDYGVYRIPPKYHSTLVKYATFLYRYRDAKPDYGDALFGRWNQQVRIASGELNRTLNRSGFKVSFKKRR